MTKDKKYIENLFRNYKKNIARIKILELNKLSDEDVELGSVNYTQKLKMGNIQTSNIQSLDNIIIAREQELKQLKNDVATTQILFDSLKDKERVIIEAYYVEGKTQIEVANLINVYDLSTVWRNREKILNNLMDII